MNDTDSPHASSEKTPLEILHGIDPNDIVRYFKNEHPQVIALIISVLQDKEHALDILHALPKDKQVEISQRIAEMSSVSYDVISAIDHVVAHIVQENQNNRNVGGVNTLVELFLSSDRSLDSPLLAKIEDQDPELAEQIRERL